VLGFSRFRLDGSCAAGAALGEAWERAARERVEVGCMGGRGRTGTGLACLAIFDGVPADQAVEYVRQHYHPDAVETAAQRQFIAEFS
jgi:protein-tyrosine phosphatase